ncbi:hypothetical protein [Phormidium nigroviride]|uniref:hypothetical protein n=1 Tax=Phormidium nigroviride TaxID=482564 RepID=UPI00167F9AA2|nr:hypothetical protein [Oscillatoria nigro-viridis]
MLLLSESPTQTLSDSPAQTPGHSRTPHSRTPPLASPTRSPSQPCKYLVTLCDSGCHEWPVTMSHLSSNSRHC